MGDSVGVKYIGKNVVYEDNILRTGLTWSKGETHILPDVMAKEFLKHPGMFAEVPGASYLIASASGEGLVFDGPTTASIARTVGFGPHITLNINNPTSVRKSLIFPRAATHVTAHWRQGSGAAATGGALFIVAGAGGDNDANAKLSAGGGRMTLLIGKRRRISLAGLASQRLDWITSASETGSTDLVLDFECPAPSNRGVDIVNAPLAMLSTDVQPYDESGNGNHLTRDAGLTAAAAAANPGFLTTAVSTTTAQFVSIPAAVFNKLNADSGDSYLLRFTADLTPPAAVCGVAGTLASAGNGWKIFLWASGKLALVVSAGGASLPYDRTIDGLVAPGVEHHYSVFVDGVNKKIYAWIDNSHLTFGQSFSGVIHTGLKCRIGGDTDTRGLTGKWRALRYVNCNGMSLGDVMDLVEYLNLSAEA